MNVETSVPSPQTGAGAIYLHPSHLLKFRLNKLVKESSRRIAARTHLFDPDRSAADLSDALALFPAFMAAHLAIAWSMHIAHALPDEDDRVYSSRYFDLDTEDPSACFTVLADQVIRLRLLSDYQLGFLIAFLTACHATTEHEAQLRLWDGFVEELSSLFLSIGAYTDEGVRLYRELRKQFPHPIQ